MSVSLDDVAAIVLNFRTADKTSLCIQSLIEEGLRNIILIDNSEDNGASLTDMQVALDSYRAGGAHITVETNGCNQGFAKGVNAGSQIARTQGLSYILLMNSDAYFEKGGLIKMLEVTSKYAFVQPMVKDKSSLNSLFGYYDKALALIYSSAKENSLKYSSGCALLIDINKLPGNILDEDFFFYGEDVELALRAKGLGLEAAECHEAHIYHEGSGSARRGSLFYEYHINRGHWLLAKKLSTTTAQKYLFYILRIFTLSTRALVRAFRYKSLIPIQGFLMSSFDFAINRIQTLTPPVKP